jgi:CheY-like chemotaxis protein
MSKIPIEILLVEDNPSDVELVREALTVWSTPTHLSTVDDGEKAVRFLHHEGFYEKAAVPDLILLDLNLPRKNGTEVLRDIKADERLSTIPVIVLTTSDREQDVKNAYRLHANCYLTKPLEMEEFIQKVQAIEEFWLGHVRLPKRLSA